MYSRLQSVQPMGLYGRHRRFGVMQQPGCMGCCMPGRVCGAGMMYAGPGVKVKSCGPRTDDLCREAVREIKLSCCQCVKQHHSTYDD